jgi:DNA polymerase III subunit alpha
MKNRTN